MAVKDKEFFEKLLDLCREYKVNIEGADVRIGDIRDPRHYEYVNVTGQWEISVDNDAVDGSLVVRPATTQEISVKGRQGHEQESDS